MAERFVTAMTVRVIWSVLSDLGTPQNKFVWLNMIQNQNQLRVFEPGNLGICVTIIEVATYAVAVTDLYCICPAMPAFCYVSRVNATILSP